MYRMVWFTEDADGYAMSGKRMESRMVWTDAELLCLDIADRPRYIYPHLDWDN